MPVCMVSWHGAQAYAAWVSARSGLPWRLPGELAWEKAARGVDGRFFPWGDIIDPSWACGRASHPDRILPRTVGAFPVDESPYGVRDLAGNMCDWCHDVFVADGPSDASARWGDVGDGMQNVPAATAYRVSRGGAWYSPVHQHRSTYRNGLDPSFRLNAMGIRLVRPFP